MDFEMVSNPKYIKEAVMNKELQAAYEQKEIERKQKERETLRDMFAMTAMGGLVSNGRGGTDYAQIAKYSYVVADEMLKAREL